MGGKADDVSRGEQGVREVLYDAGCGYFSSFGKWEWVGVESDER